MMPNITYDSVTFSCHADETVLDSFLREKISIPYGCQQGVCQACLMRSLNTPPPTLAQVGLKDTLKKQNYFLACVCYPTQDMTVTAPNAKTDIITAQVIEKQKLAPDIIRLIVQYDDEFKFCAGQFVNLHRDDGLVRSYSIANFPQDDRRLEFHIRQLPNGQFSRWLYHDLHVGMTLNLSQARGDCYYVIGRAEQPLLLIGTGTGLAPLYGIACDALAQGHVGDIHLFHGSRSRDGLYLVDEMRNLAERFSNFHYTPCLSGEDVSDGYSAGRAHDVALSRFAQLKNWRVYLCGHPEMVNEAKRRAFLNGASLNDIYADAFRLS